MEQCDEHHALILSFSTHRSRKRKQEEESDEEDDYDKDEEDDSPNDEDLQSDAASSDDEDDFIDDDYEGEGDNRVVPTLYDSDSWYRKSREADQRSLFQSVDGDKIFRSYHCWFGGGRFTNLSWDVRGALSKGQKALVAKQRKRSITLERVFGRSSKLSQVPYRKLEYSLH